MSYFAAGASDLPNGGPVVTGKENIRKALEPWSPDVHLTSTPVYADMAASGGDLGYTFGTYVYTANDKDGKLVAHYGKYTTVCKGQSDGSWKVVLDWATLLRWLRTTDYRPFISPESFWLFGHNIVGFLVSGKSSQCDAQCYTNRHTRVLKEIREPLPYGCDLPCLLQFLPRPSDVAGHARDGSWPRGSRLELGGIGGIIGQENT
jgi:ketosteroid isomerase-like protein